MDHDLDRGWPMYNTLGSVPPDHIAKISLWRLLFQRYEASATEIQAIIDELAADRIGGGNTRNTIPGVIERQRGRDYIMPIGFVPQLIENWQSHHIRPGVENQQRRTLALWLHEALREARQREQVTR